MAKPKQTPTKRRRPSQSSLTIHARECSSLAMTAGNEKRFSKVVDEGRVLQWVGIGWVDEGPESRFPNHRFPRVVRD